MCESCYLKNKEETRGLAAEWMYANVDFLRRRLEEGYLCQCDYCKAVFLPVPEYAALSPYQYDPYSCQCRSMRFRPPPTMIDGETEDETEDDIPI
jgi:hypothetical protein